jgi:hypothetical protein
MFSFDEFLGQIVESKIQQYRRCCKPGQQSYPNPGAFQMGMQTQVIANGKSDQPIGHKGNQGRDLYILKSPKSTQDHHLQSIGYLKKCGHQQ